VKSGRMTLSPLPCEGIRVAGLGSAIWVDVLGWSTCLVT
jgi:hypothetical protein